MQSKSIRVLLYFLVCLAIANIAGCSIALEFLKDHFPVFYPFDLETDKFEFTQSPIRLDGTECPDLRGMYSVDAQMHQITEWKRKVVSDQKDTVREPIISHMRIRKRNAATMDALPEYGTYDPDVFWIVQEQNGNLLEFRYWDTSLYLDGGMESKISIVRFSTNNKEFSCKGGYIYFNQFLYFTDGSLPRPGTFPAGMALSGNGNLLYFMQGTSTEWDGNFFTGGRKVYFFDSIYEYPRITDNQD